MSLAIFDLDNTLIAGDSDHAWGEFLVRHQYVDAEHYRQANDRFHQQYTEGQLDILEYLQFALAPLANHDRATLEQWRSRFMTEVITPMMLPAAKSLLSKHREAGDTLLIITATNRFITEPIAEALQVDDLIAVEPEIIDGRYTGRIAGLPTFQEGKVTRLKQWLTSHQMTLSGSYFYSDSRNDLPLLEQVDHPVAVDPDPTLRARAEAEGWPIISLR
ncbi:phosphoserine phosphatase [Terasakiispira papahanaumokuakeensis]|uniref:Histidinol-phosphatase n=1 Tax=Terasakiispira papahanaumokuakeensis TaxID=197479 RepID=A0A1E2VE23_9GAMM|nr:HAD family hydrolase [Terasakiispira papahanaumokuakeensis]ODC05112.1 phosphoserine phosphatase [Terasakiispira papahanaumokuakeensis]